MSLESQQQYMHGIPRDNTCSSLRVSITFRQLNSATGSDMNMQSAISDIDRIASTPVRQYSEETFDSFPDSLPDISADVTSTDEPALHKNLNPDTTENLVDTLYISSSMFRNLDASKLSTDSHRASVHYFPGATAAGILKRLQLDSSFRALDSSKVKQIFLLCGTNNIDNILHIPKNMRDSFNVNLDCYDPTQFQQTLSEVEKLFKYLHEWARGAKINVINILPRASLARNTVINDLNCFMYKLCGEYDYLDFVSTELNRYLFIDRFGYRRDNLFNVVGSDNVHLNSQGTIKLAKLLKFLCHVDDKL